jgi:tripartite-type tricarboxylate transporter receptor subunit TctC
MMAPKGTPAEVITYLEGMLKQITEAPSFAETLAAGGTAPGFVDAVGSKAVMETMKADAEPILASVAK